MPSERKKLQDREITSRSTREKMPRPDAELERIRTGAALKANSVGPGPAASFAGTSSLDNDKRVAGTPDHVGRFILESGHQKTDSTDSRVLQGHSTNDALRAVQNPHIKNGEVSAEKLAKPSVGAIEMFDLNVINQKLAANCATKSKVAAQAVGIFEAHDELRGGNGADWRLRRQSGTGANTTTNFADHFHSIPFTRLEKTERLRINALATTLEKHRKTQPPGPIADLLEAMADVLHMLCDDPDLDRWERERILDTNDERAMNYRADHFMHGDGPMHDHGPDLADRPSKAALWSTDEDRFKSAKVANVMAFKRALAASDGKAED